MPPVLARFKQPAMEAESHHGQCAPARALERREKGSKTMAGTPQFVAISAFQSPTIDWHAYRAWTAQWDGIARVGLRSSYGTGRIEQHFALYREGALKAGIDIIIFSYYAYPQFNSEISAPATFSCWITKRMCLRLRPSGPISSWPGKSRTMAGGNRRSTPATALSGKDCRRTASRAIL